VAFIAKNGCSLKRSHIYVRRTLDRLSPTATTEQLNHILNGYADLYKLGLYFIDVMAEAPIDEKNIRIFGGTSSNIEQRNRHRNIAFIMYNVELSLFAPLYVTHSDGHPQTCFVADDERITDHIVDLFRQLNQEGKSAQNYLRNLFFLSIKYPRDWLCRQITTMTIMVLRKMLKNYKQQIVQIRCFLYSQVNIIIRII
jgi:hypothetical protein